MKKLFYLTLGILSITLKIHAQAPGWLWAKSAGGANIDWGNNISIDANGNTIVIGTFYSYTLNLGTTTLNNAGPGHSDIFIVKYSALGNILWAKSVGGTGNDFGQGIATDAMGNIFVTGYFYSPTITFGTTTLTNTGGSCVFTVKYNTAGNVVWAKSAGGSGKDTGNGISTDAVGNVIVTGSFDSLSINFGSIALTSPNPNRDFMFIVKYDSSGNALWAKSPTGGCNGKGSYIATDASGNSLVAGSFLDSTTTFGATTLTNAGFTDFFVVKYDTAGNVLWAISAGGNDFDYCFGIVTDSNNNLYITGGYKSSYITFGTTTLTNSGDYDFFTVKYDAAGNVLWVKSAGGDSFDEGTGITIDANGNPIVAGHFSSPTITFGTTTLNNTGSTDIFIVKYDTLGNELWAKSRGDSAYEEIRDIATNANGNVFVTGLFKGLTITFGATTLTNASNLYDDEFFIAKMDTNTNCSSHFYMYADTIPHNWIAVNQATGVMPVSYLWSWGDSSTSIGSSPIHTYNIAGYYDICLSITDANGCTGNYCDSSTYLYKSSSNLSVINVSVINQPLGINNLLENEATLNISPNPVKNEITIGSKYFGENVLVKIYDAFGKEVISKKLLAPSSNVYIMNLANGIYFVKLQNEMEIMVKKFVKE